MWRGVLLACLPWGLLLFLAQALLIAGVLLFRGHFSPSRVALLWRDERGSVQSLSFVLTLPFLVLVILFIVQVAQLMVATIVVHYGAFAAARAALVWIPANVGASESENRLGIVQIDPMRWDQDLPILDSQDPLFGPSEGGVWYRVEPIGPKYQKIASAAVLACASISPSSQLPFPRSGRASLINTTVFDSAYRALVPSAAANPQVSQRLRNKLEYASEATDVEIYFFHPNSEPPLVSWDLPPDPNQFYSNEVGWQDPIVVTVRYKVALMPTIGKILARPAALVTGRDRVSSAVEPWGGIFVYPISATIMLGNEGDIPRYSYPETIW